MYMQMHVDTFKYIHDINTNEYIVKRYNNNYKIQSSNYSTQLKLGKNIQVKQRFTLLLCIFVVSRTLSHK